MNPILRWLIATAVFVAILLLGDLFGIHPTFAELILVALAAGCSNGIGEDLR